MEQNFRIKLGLNIKFQRIKKGLTQEQLGELTDISTKHITKIENAKVTPSSYMLYKIASSLSCSIDKLVADISD